MSVTSLTFLFVFLPITIVAYYAACFIGRNRSGNRSAAKALLLVASIIFYSLSALEFIPHLLVLTGIVYILARVVQNKKGMPRKAITAIGIIANVSFLAFYKYFDFFGALCSWLFKTPFTSFGILQPLGISFLVFSLISYLIDVHRGTIAADKNLINVLLWSFFFAKIAAGPIVRYAQMYRTDQAMQDIPCVDEIAAGVRRFVIGLGKKVILANTLGLTVDKIFSAQIDGISTPVAWIGIICYTFQIYLDFSGYSDMALGVARMLGFRFEENFNYPYAARTVGEFWRRWHISLSSWLRDYLYFPLGGSRRGNVYVNLIVVFLVSGLWHGASLHFVAWGAWWGLFMVIDRAYRVHVAPRHALPTWLTWFFTMSVVVLGWVIFRAESSTQAVSYLLNLVGIGADPTFPWGVRYYLDNRTITFLAASLLLSTPLFKSLERRYENTPVWQACRMIGTPILFLASIMFIMNADYSPFRYAQF